MLKIEKGDLSEIRNCIQLYPKYVDMKNKCGNCAITTAIRLNSLEILYELLINKANVNTMNKSGQTPLHIAAFNNQSEVVRILLEFGANVRISDMVISLCGIYTSGIQRGWSTLMIAANKGYSDIVEQLLEGGSDIFSRNLRGECVFDLVKNKEILELIVYRSGYEISEIENQLGNTILRGFRGKFSSSRQSSPFEMNKRVKSPLYVISLNNHSHLNKLRIDLANFHQSEQKYISPSKDERKLSQRSPTKVSKQSEYSPSKIQKWCQYSSVKLDKLCQYSPVKLDKLSQYSPTKLPQGQLNDEERQDAYIINQEMKEDFLTLSDSEIIMKYKMKIMTYLNRKYSQMTPLLCRQYEFEINQFILQLLQNLNLSTIQKMIILLKYQYNITVSGKDDRIIHNNSQKQLIKQDDNPVSLSNKDSKSVKKLRNSLKEYKQESKPEIKQSQDRLVQRKANQPNNKKYTEIQNVLQTNIKERFLSNQKNGRTPLKKQEPSLMKESKYINPKQCSLLYVNQQNMYCSDVKQNNFNGNEQRSCIDEIKNNLIDIKENGSKQSSTKENYKTNFQNEQSMKTTSLKKTKHSWERSLFGMKSKQTLEMDGIIEQPSLETIETPCNDKQYDLSLLADKQYDVNLRADKQYDVNLRADKQYDVSLHAGKQYDLSLLADKQYDLSLCVDKQYDLSLCADKQYDLSLPADKQYDLSFLAEKQYDLSLLADKEYDLRLLADKQYGLSILAGKQYDFTDKEYDFVDKQYDLNLQAVTKYDKDVEQIADISSAQKISARFYKDSSSRCNAQEVNQVEEAHSRLVAKTDSIKNQTHNRMIENYPEQIDELTFSNVDNQKRTQVESSLMETFSSPAFLDTGKLFLFSTEKDINCYDLHYPVQPERYFNLRNTSFKCMSPGQYSSGGIITHPTEDNETQEIILSPPRHISESPPGHSLLSKPIKYAQFSKPFNYAHDNHRIDPTPTCSSANANVLMMQRLEAMKKKKNRQVSNNKYPLH